jgi:uncharacterized DUF497 family protein
VKIEFDPAKSETNATERGLPFGMVCKFDWSGAVFTGDTRVAYPERRFVAVGRIGARVHVVCFTPVQGGVRVISFRKANAREAKRYDKETFDR